MNLACGGWIAAAVGVAAELGIADHLAGGPRTAEELARTTRTAPGPLGAMLHLLVEAGVFAEAPPGTFANTPDSELLRADHPNSVRAWCRLAAGDYQRIFHGMSHTVRTGEPSALPQLGATLYDYLAAQPSAADIYDRAMQDLAAPLAALLATSYDFSAARLVADIGGGRGTIVRGLLLALPHLSGICFDRPATCERAERDLDPALRGRLSYHAGDFFESVPAADIYVLKNVLHNWGDAKSTALLRVIATAMRGRADSRLLIIEPLKDVGMPGMYAALDAMLQMVICEPGATPRNADQLSALARDAGFEVVSIRPLRTGHSLIETSVI
jgi:C-methyltransferase